MYSTMYQSPRTRRLHNDLAALDRLRSQSSVFRFSAEGDPPQQYSISLIGKGLWRDRGKVKILETHRVEIKLGASYPRTMPEIRWVTPIYHPNISEIGMVCLGGYGTHWVPSVQLDELCIMLWDMARYHNYDIRSPYNRDAALWVASQANFLFPTDGRPLRDLRAAVGRISPSPTAERPDPVSKPKANIETSLRRSPFSQTDDRAWIYTLAGALDRQRNRAHHRSAMTRVRRFIERYGRIFRNGGVAGPNVGAVRPRPVDYLEATDLASSHHASPDAEAAELVMPEPVTRVQPELLSPGSDDIVFIE